MKNKKLKLLFINVIVAVTAIITLSGCVASDYGRSFTSTAEIKTFIENLGLTGVKYPTYLGEATKKPTDPSNSSYEYVCSKNGTVKDYICYKLYHFSAYYSYSVYTYFDETAEYVLKSDLRAEFKEKITLNEMEITVSLGKVTDEEYFVIFGFVANGRQTEIRISGASKNTKIVYGNQHYSYALGEMEKIIESMS